MEIIQTRFLRKGDKVDSGEIIVKVCAGVKTPKRKQEVTLYNEKTETTRTTLWGTYTPIGVFNR